MSRVGELRTYLMGAPRDQLDLEKRKISRLVHRDDLIFRHRLLRVFRLARMNDDSVLLRDLLEKAAKRRFSPLRNAVNGAKVYLVELTCLYLLVHHLQGDGIFSRDNEPRRVSVDTVAKRGSERILLTRNVIAFFIKIELYVVDERIQLLVLVGMDDQARRLIGDEYILVLIYNNEPRLLELRELQLFVRLVAEKFV